MDIDYNIIIFKTIEFINNNLMPIIKEINEGLEENLFMYHITSDYLKEFKVKQKNIIKTSNFKNINEILEIGFNSGFSALLFLNSNTNINITCIDIGINKCTIPCYNKIKEFYGDRINLLIGNSIEVLPTINNKFDLIHIDSSHDINNLREDIINCYYLSKNKCTLIMDNYDIPCLNQTWNELSEIFKFEDIDDIFKNKYQDIKRVNKYSFFPEFNNYEQGKNIPKIIHQIAPKDKTHWHPLWEKCQKTWKLNFPSPEYEYKLWSDEEDIENLIKNNYPFFYDTFMNYPKKINRIDMARYFILIKYGGIYADMDFYCYKNFYNLLDNSKVSIPYSTFSEDEILQNSLIASPINCQYFYDVIDEAIRRKLIEKSSKIETVSFKTGPKLISYIFDRLKSYVDPLDKELYNPIPCHLLDDEKYNENTCYCKHFGTGCW